MAEAVAGAVTDVAAASTLEEALERGATTGAVDTVVEVSTTAGVDELELGWAPIAASVTAEFTVGNNALELASVGEAVMDSTEEEVPA